MCPEQQEARLSVEGELGPPERGSSLEKVFTFSTVSASRSSQEIVTAFKFGGSSLLGAEGMLHSAALAREAALRSRVCVVVSAMKGVTDRLLASRNCWQGTNRKRQGAERRTLPGCIWKHCRTSNWRRASASG